MTKVQVITDSTADIPKHLIEELGIVVVPLKVHLSGESYLDGVTISPSQFYERLKESDEMPTTSQPSPIDFVEAYREAAKDGNVDILSIHLSSAFSGTYQSALLARSMVEDEFKVTVVDSKKASYAIGMIVVEVARAAKEGKSLDECVAIANRLIEEEQVFFLVDTLEYLQKGGRIGKASAVVGSLLNIKPILSISPEGEVFPVDKVRGKAKAISRIFEMLKENLPEGAKDVAVLYTDNREEADKWADRLKETFRVDHVEYTEIGPVIGAHVGSGNHRRGLLTQNILSPADPQQSGVTKEGTRMKFRSVFDIIGPVMIGPSSSHTAGAARIGRAARTLFGRLPRRVTITLYGSFAKTYQGHGTDVALVGGLLDFDTDDERMVQALEIARESGVEVTFIESEEVADHPNTARLHLEDDQGDLEVTGISIGGGKMEIVELNGFELRLSGSAPALLVTHHDRYGAVAKWRLSWQIIGSTSVICRYPEKRRVWKR